jgi:hypothetical protein
LTGVYSTRFAVAQPAIAITTVRFVTATSAFVVMKVFNGRDRARIPIDRAGVRS